MPKILNITNGDSAVEIMEKADIVGDFLPWRDVLHEGPVPDARSLEALSTIRANYIANQGWGPKALIKQSFIDRDNALKSTTQYEKIILWFEHDLYDQLQILQILDWFHLNRPKTAALCLICVDQYLGMLTPTEMTALFKYERPVSDQHFDLAMKAWSAFRSDTPEKWQALLKTDTTALPFLEASILRLLEEYPSCANGLSRTAHQALDIIEQGASKPAKIFGLFQQTEERRFLGDRSFGAILQEFSNANPPLIKKSTDQPFNFQTKSDQSVNITQAGKDVLSGNRHWLHIQPSDRWIGGVHLTSANIWCRDAQTGTLVRGTAPP